MKFLLVLTLLTFRSQAQLFERSQNKALGKTIVRYYDRAAGVLVQKVTFTSNDPEKIVYELGLVVFKRGRSSDDFMEDNAYITFTDQSVLNVPGKISINYFQEGRHQYSVKHYLAESEMKFLKSKVIQRICVSGECNMLDKWQGPKAQNAFQEIEKQ